jgi:hypothetical protein
MAVFVHPYNISVLLKNSYVLIQLFPDIIHLFICLCISMSVCLFSLSLCSSVCLLSMCLPTATTICLSVVVRLTFCYSIYTCSGSCKPDLRCRLSKAHINSGKPQGVGILEWGGNGEGMEMGRSVYEQPGTKVDGILSQQGGFQVS